MEFVNVYIKIASAIGGQMHLIVILAALTCAIITVIVLERYRKN